MTKLHFLFFTIFSINQSMHTLKSFFFYFVDFRVDFTMHHANIYIYVYTHKHTHMASQCYMFVIQLTLKSQKELKMEIYCLDDSRTLETPGSETNDFIPHSTTKSRSFMFTQVPLAHKSHGKYPKGMLLYSEFCPVEEPEVQKPPIF